jgi:hypothetical protein
MIIIRNQKLIKRNRSIGTITGILAILVLGAGTYFSFQYRQQVNISLIALLVGFFFYQVSIYYSNRFVRTPRPDEELDAALKGLDDSYALYHYQSPVSHLLVGPAGVWILQPYPQKGKIIYDQESGRWKRKGGNLYLRFFAQDRIGKPDQSFTREQKDLKKELSKIPELEMPAIKGALVFIDEDVVVEADDAPLPTLHARQLKKLIRKESKGDETLPHYTATTIQDHLGLESNQ